MKYFTVLSNTGEAIYLVTSSLRATVLLLHVQNIVQNNSRKT